MTILVQPASDFYMSSARMEDAVYSSLAAVLQHHHHAMCGSCHLYTHCHCHVMHHTNENNLVA